MSEFRKKLIVIEAVQVNATDFSFQGGFDGNPFNEPAPPWLVEALKAGVIVPDTPGSTDYAEWKIPTLEGDMWAGPGDWIIRGVKGELYPCKPDIFSASYDPVNSPSPASGGEIVEKLRRKYAPDFMLRHGLINPDGPAAATLIEQQAATIAELEGRVGEARRVLEPFAEVSETIDAVGRPNEDDDDRIWIVQAHGCKLADCTEDHFRAAARFLSSSGGEDT